MPAKFSAGIVLFRTGANGLDDLEVLLAHPGGPFWARKDAGAWSIPKGEYEPDEAPFAAAVREFTEEVGRPPPTTAPIELGTVQLASGKTITAWGIEGDLDVTTAVSTTFSIEWPKGSGQLRTYPEVDRVEWYSVDAARPKLNPALVALLDRLHSAVASR